MCLFCVQSLILELDLDLYPEVKVPVGIESHFNFYWFVHQFYS